MQKSTVKFSDEINFRLTSPLSSPDPDASKNWSKIPPPVLTHSGFWGSSSQLTVVSSFSPAPFSDESSGVSSDSAINMKIEFC